MYKYIQNIQLLSAVYKKYIFKSFLRKILRVSSLRSIGSSLFIEYFQTVTVGCITLNVDFLE